MRPKTRFSIGDWWEEVDYHDGVDGRLVVVPWCRTARYTPALCNDKEMGERTWARLCRENGVRRPEKVPR